MSFNLTRLIAGTYFFAFTLHVAADEVLLQDGTRLVGDVRELNNDKLVIDTAFASGLEINKTMISGISTDDKVMVKLKSGDQLKGKLAYSNDAGQQLQETTFGNISLTTQTGIVGLWQEGESPVKLADNQAHEKEITELKQTREKELAKVEEAYQSEINELKEEKARYENPWSGNVGLGMSGKQGNTDTLSVHGRAEGVRDTGHDRLFLYLEGKLEEQNEVTTTNEVITGASLEHDLSERWFVFGSADFEKDEFENLDLRGVAKTGVGYFFIRRPELVFKGLAGLGYQHETFTDGTTLQEGIISLGYDFKYDFKKFWDVGHKLTYFPSMTSPASDYRLVSYLYTEVPIVSADAPWKIRLTLRNDYDSEPRPGIKELDTSYNFNVVYDFE